MANLIERKRRRRRKVDFCDFEEKKPNNNEENLLTQRITSFNFHHTEETTTTFGQLQNKSEFKNGIKQQQNCSRLQPEQPEQRLSLNDEDDVIRNSQRRCITSSGRRRRDGCLTSAIHKIMLQNGGRRSFPRTSESSLPTSSLSLLLLISIAFTLSMTFSMNLMTVFVEASGTITPQQQQQQQSSASAAAASQLVGGNAVIVSSSSPGPSNSVIGGSGSGKARYKTMYACEDRQLTMDCDFGSKINLIRANYGRFSITQCNEQGQLDLSTDCMSPITFRIMKERCQDKQKCSVNATSTIFGDKCPKTRKYLEVHFQCQPDPRQQQQHNHHQQPAHHNSEPIERVNVSQLTTPSPPTPIVYPASPNSGSGSSHLLPPNNPTIGSLVQQARQPSSSINDDSSPSLSSSSSSVANFPGAVHQQQQQQQQVSTTIPQQPYTVMNSEIMDYNAIVSSINNNIPPESEQIIVTLRHLYTESMSNPRCFSWDSMRKEWTQRGNRIVDTNLTHTTCAFDQATSYVLLMDHHPTALATQPIGSISSSINNNNPTISPPMPSVVSQQLPVPGYGPLDRGFLEKEPILLVNSNSPSQQQTISSGSSSPLVKFFSLFGYLLAIVFVAIAFITIAFIASTMRTSGTTLKSLGNFTAFGGPKYKNRRPMDDNHPNGLHNKDLLVINNQNGHQFLYAPASTTKINSSTSTHIMTSGGGNQNTLQHHNLQHLQQQQQMYSGNGTLSNLSGTGGQSNYYFGLPGSLFQQQQSQQQQQQVHHLSQHHLNQQQAMQQQGLNQANYQHQANKSTISNESANSSPSSSGVESASTSLQQQHLHQLNQQQQQQQSCLMMNSEYSLMGQVNNYNHQTLLSQPFQQQPQLTLNAHYSSSGPMGNNMNQQQQQQRQLMQINSNTNNQLLREHIYESVDDDNKQCLSRQGGMLLPHNDHQSPELLFNSSTLSHQMNQVNNLSQQQQQQQQVNLNRAMTLSSRLLQNAIQQQQQQQQQQPLINNQTNKRLVSHPAIVRDNQTKTNIICSKLAQVTPQRATEINNKFQHDIMAIFNANEATTTTTTTAATTNSPSIGFNRSGGSELVNDLVGSNSNNNNKVSTDC